MLEPAEVLLLGGFLVILLLLFRLRRIVVKLLAMALVLPNVPLPDEILLREFPPWMSFIILSCVALPVLRRLVAVGIDRRASDAMVGILAVDLLRFTVRTAFLPVRVVWWVLRWIGR
jgi:hypothetical protein